MKNKFLSLLLCFSLVFTAVMPVSFAEDVPDGAAVETELTQAGGDTEEAGEAASDQSEAVSDESGEGQDQELTEAGSEDEGESVTDETSSDSAQTGESMENDESADSQDSDSASSEGGEASDKDTAGNSDNQDVSGDEASDNQSSSSDQEADTADQGQTEENTGSSQGQSAGGEPAGSVEAGSQTEQPAEQTIQEPAVPEVQAPTQSLYELIMACESYEELLALEEEYEDTDSEELETSMTADQYIEAKLHALDLLEEYEEANPQTEIEIPEDDVVSVSEVADFLPPVDGTDNAVQASSVKSKSAKISLMALSVSALSVKALGSSSSDSMESTGSKKSGLILDKTAEKTEEGKYKITLKSFVTGKVDISDVQKAVPADIVLVLDNSGSMDDEMTVCSNQSGTSALSYLNSTYGGGEGVYTCDISYNSNSKSENCRMRYNEGKWQVEINVGWWIFDDYEWYDVDSTSGVKDIQIINVYTTKLNAMKIAVKNFIDSVNAKTTASDGSSVEHRISIVQFASDVESKGRDYHYYGTKINCDFMSVSSNAENLKDIVNGMKAGGATYTDKAMELASYEITESFKQKSDDRSRVVILFTDGEPTYNSKFENNVANTAISNSKAIKDKGASVYSIGIMSGADDTFPMEKNASQVNRFMHYVSSNYPSAQSMDKPGNPKSDTSTSFYLAAGNAEKLNEVFQSIAEKIQTGGASMTLDESAVLEDDLSEYFKLIDEDSIKVYTAPYTGYDSGGSRTFGTPVELKSASVTVDGKTIKVSGFDYSSSANCVTDTQSGGKTTYSGNQLIVEIPAVPENLFLGGNGVPTNTDDSGIYYNSEKIDGFDIPEVDVPVKTPAVSVEDKNVYLLGSLTKADLISGAQVNCSISGSDSDVKVPLTFNAETGKLEPAAGWQAEYVKITYDIKDSAGNVLADQDSDLSEALLSSLQADTTYMLDVTLTPTADGEYGYTQGDGTGNINVFTPEMTFKDSTVWYGDIAPDSDYFKAQKNKTGATLWKHGDTLSTAVTMLGASPELYINYRVPQSAVAGDVVATKHDIPVTVGVTAGSSKADITAKTTFNHKKCSDSESLTSGNFLLHVKTCSLTLNKNGGEADEPYVFNIKRNGSDYMEVTTKAGGSAEIKELPVGTYTIAEDKGWNWRWTPSYSSDSVTLSSSQPSATVTCTNTKSDTKWLNDYAGVTNTRSSGGSSESSSQTLTAVLAETEIKEVEDSTEGGDKDAE